MSLRCHYLQVGNIPRIKWTLSRAVRNDKCVMNIITDRHTYSMMNDRYTKLIISQWINSTSIKNSNSELRGKSKTVMNKIFSNAVSPNIISGYLTSSIWNHLPKFHLLLPFFLASPNSSFSIYETERTKFEKGSFILDYLLIDWDQTLRINIYDTDKHFKNFLDKLTFSGFIFIL